MDARNVLLVLLISVLIASSGMLVFLLVYKEPLREYPLIPTYDTERFRLPANITYNSTVISSLRTAGDYLLNHIKSSGRWDYEYDAGKDSSSRSYNVLRHAGTTYSLCLIFQYTRELRYYNGTILTLNYLLSHFCKFGEMGGREVAYIEYGGYAKLGGAALALLALTEVVEIDPMVDYSRELNGLANFTVEMQREDGSFQCFYKEREKEHSDYYPGEALLTLSKLYELGGDQEHLDALTTGLEYYNAYFPNGYTAFTPWATEAMLRAFEWTQRPEYLDKSYAMAWACMRGQIGPGPGSDEKVVGSFSSDPGASTASRLEGIFDSYMLAARTSDERNMTSFKRGMELGAGFLISFQLNRSDVESLPDPEDALGGFPNSYSDMNVRIDYVQHAVVVLVKYMLYSGSGVLI